MPNQTITPANSRQTQYDVYWNNAALGGLDKVSPKLEKLLAAIKIGSLGAMKLDDRFQGLTDDSGVDLAIRETASGALRTQLQKFLPWSDQTAGRKMGLTPALGALMKQYAKVMRLHPRDLAVDAVSEDVVLNLMLPIDAHNIERTGTGEDVWNVKFKIYPDLTKAAGYEYGYIDGTDAP